MSCCIFTCYNHHRYPCTINLLLRPVALMHWTLCARGDCGAILLPCTAVGSCAQGHVCKQVHSVQVNCFYSVPCPLAYIRIIASRGARLPDSEPTACYWNLLASRMHCFPSLSVSCCFVAQALFLHHSHALMMPIQPCLPFPTPPPHSIQVLAQALCFLSLVTAHQTHRKLVALFGGAAALRASFWATFDTEP